MSQVSQQTEELKSLPIPSFTPDNVKYIMDVVNQIPTMYGVTILDYIKQVALDQYRASQESATIPEIVNP